MLFVGFLNGVDAEVDLDSLEVAEVDGRGLRWTVHEVASGVKWFCEGFPQALQVGQV